MGALSPTHWMIVVGVLVLLFGAKKMPDFARSVGQSMRILKAETNELRDHTTTPAGAPTDPTPASITAPAHQPATANPTTANPTVANSTAMPQMQPTQTPA